MKISVVIPVYNREDCISECIQSVLIQSYSNWEMIVVDNASSDATAEIVETAIADDSRCLLIRNTHNLGPTENWLLGVEHAKCKWVKILFSDDKLLPGALDAFVAAARRSEPNAFILDGNLSYSFDKLSSSKFLFKNIVSHELFVVSPSLALMPRDTLIEAFKIEFCPVMTKYGKETGAGYDLMSFLLCCARAKEHIVLKGKFTEFGRPKSSITLSLTRSGSRSSLFKQYYRSQIWFLKHHFWATKHFVSIFQYPVLFVFCYFHFLRADYVANKIAKMQPKAQ